MRVLIIGGSGFIGRPLARALAERGIRPTVFAAQTDGLGPSVSCLRGNRHEPSDMRRLSGSAGSYDAVIDLIAYTGPETRAMIEMWRGRVGRFIHLSTLSVYAAAHAPQVSEDNAVRWEPTGETYGACKASCERALEDAGESVGFPFVILRTPPLMGPGDHVSRENYFVKRLLRAETILVPGRAGAHVSLLFAGDLIRVIVAALFRDGVTGRSYNLAQREQLTLERHIAEIAGLCGVRADIRHVPEDVFPSRGLNPFAFPYAPLGYQAWVETARAERELGFAPTPYPHALEETIRSLLCQSPCARPAWPGRNSMQSRLAGTHEWLFAEDLRRLSRRRPWATDGHGAVNALPALHPDTLLSNLTGGPGCDPGLLFASHTSWQARECAEPASTGPDGEGVRRVMVLPDQTSTGAGGETCQPLEGSPPRRPLAGECQLEAVLESDALDGGRSAWLYTRHQSVRARSYSHSNYPMRVRFASFSGYDWGAEVPPTERVVLIPRRRRDVEALSAWIAGCEARGSIAVKSPASWGRIFLALGGPLLGLPESQTASGLPPLTTGSRWARLFDVCRLLNRTDAFGRGVCEVEVEISTPSRRVAARELSSGVPAERRAGDLPAASLTLVRSRGRYFACDLSRGRAHELTLALAALVDVIDTAPADEAAAVGALRSVLRLSATQARRIYADGLHILSRHGIIETGAG